MFQIATLPSPTEVPPSPRAGGRALVLPWTSAQFVSLRMVASPGLKLNIPAFGRRPRARIAMIARVPIIRSAGLLIYLVAMVATGLLTVMLLSILATQAIALAQPYFVDNSACKPSRIEQSRSGHCSPCPHSFAAKLAKCLTADQVTLNVESIVDGGVC